MKITKLTNGGVIKEPEQAISVESRHYQILEDLVKARDISMKEAFKLMDKIYFPEGCACDSVLVCSRCTMDKAVKTYDTYGYWD